MEVVIPGLIYFAIIAYGASLARRLVLAAERIAQAVEEGKAGSAS